MRTLSVRQLLFSLFLVAHSLPDWDFKTQISDTSSESVVDNGIDNFSDELAATEGANEFAQVPDEGNGNLDALNLQGSGCNPDIDRRTGKMRARRGDVCSPDGLQLNNNNGESERQSTPTTPKSQEIQPGQNSGGGSGPERQKIKLPSPHDPLPEVFMPEKTRPRLDQSRCYQRGYNVPVCAKESDQYLAPGSVDTYILDPCNPCMFLFFPGGFFADISLHNCFKKLRDEGKLMLKVKKRSTFSFPSGGLSTTGTCILLSYHSSCVCELKVNFISPHITKDYHFF